MHAVVAIVPLYNHAGAVLEVLQGVLAQGLLPIVVDDGSTDGGGDRVAAWFAQHCPNGRLIRLDSNQGKARALLAGFGEAAAVGATHALTLDADGQHEPRFIGSFLAEAELHGWSQVLLLGDRTPIPAHYPLARLTGRMLSGLAIRAACGAVVHDAACGMRLYPLATTRAIRCIGGRYAWEEEAVIRSLWAGARVATVPISVVYRDDAIAPSHYRFGRDWTEGTLVLLASVARRIVDPRTRWASSDTPPRVLLWPALPAKGVRGFYCSMIAACGTGVAAALASGCAAIGTPMAATVGVGAIAAFVMWRTRCPIAPPALGWCAGAVSPALGLAVALLVAPAWCLLQVRALRMARR